MIEVLIFDFDGLLVDSLSLQHKAYEAAFARYKHPLSRSDWTHWAKHSYTAKRWIEEHQLNIDPEKIRRDKQDVFMRLIQEELQLMPGAERTLIKLSQEFRMCIASASRFESIDAGISKFGLHTYFERIISSVDVEKSKPDPSVFLEAASQMKCEAKKCLVLEDSPSGLLAARNAGMPCIVCPSAEFTNEASDFSGADLVVDRLDKISVEAISNLSGD